MAVFWAVAPCSLVEKFTNVSEDLAASIIRAMTHCWLVEVDGDAVSIIVLFR
jgi:hypothetical protein